MTTHIDEQVAEFAAQLDGLAVIDASRIAQDVAYLTVAILTAPTHTDAAVAVREFHDSREAEYARAIIVAAVAQVGLRVILSAPIPDLLGDDGLLARIHRLAYAVRGLGVAEWAEGRL